MSLIKVENYPGLVRDSNTGAILNTNQTNVKQAIANRKNAQSRAIQLNDITNRVNNLENVVDTINKKLDLLLTKLL